MSSDHQPPGADLDVAAARIGALIRSREDRDAWLALRAEPARLRTMLTVRGAQLAQLRAVETAARAVYEVAAPDELVPGGAWEALRDALATAPASTDDGASPFAEVVRVLRRNLPPEWAGLLERELEDRGVEVKP